MAAGPGQHQILSLLWPSVNVRRPAARAVPVLHAGTGVGWHRETVGVPSRKGSNQYRASRVPRVLARPAAALAEQAAQDWRPLLPAGPNADSVTKAHLLAANDPGTPADVLAELALDPAWQVRTRVCLHHNVPASTLEMLSLDKTYQVRWHVASDPRTPPAVLGRMLRDEYPQVRRAAASNPSLPRHLLAMYQLTGGT